MGKFFEKVLSGPSERGIVFAGARYDFMLPGRKNTMPIMGKSISIIKDASFWS